MFFIRQHTKKLIFVFLLAVCLIPLCLGIQHHFNEQITFSHPSGFYEDAFFLEMSSGPAYDIYYTLDGSEPTAESYRYEWGKPIEITDPTHNPNQFTVKTDPFSELSALLPKDFCDEGLDKSSAEQVLDKCTVIRAAPFFLGEKVSDSVCRVYFTDWQNRVDYQNAYIVSLIAAPEDLFGREKGIMVSGQLMDDYLATASGDPNLMGDSLWWPANYHQSGENWERVANITVFNPDFGMELDQTCGIRIHGGVSRALPLKSIRCYARQEYAGLDHFDVPWFGEETSPNKFTLYSGGNEYQFNLKDCLISYLCKDLNVSTMEFIPCALFINGEYWGFYHISEHYNKKYLADHFSVHENNVVMIKAGMLAEGREHDMLLYTDMVDYITNMDMTDEHHYRTACDLIDLDSYIDYYALQIYIARNGDWPSGNYALWRTVDPENVPYGDGKWRWMFFDANSNGMASPYYTYLEHDTLQMVLESDPMFASLFRNQAFQKKFADRILYIGSQLLTPDRCDSFTDTFFEEYHGLYQKTGIRLESSTAEIQLDIYQENLHSFFAERYSIILNHLKQHLDSTVWMSLAE